MERLEKIRTEIKKIVKKPYVVPVILAVVTLLIIFAKVQDNQAGKGTSAPESSKQNRTEVKESNPTPDSFVQDNSQTPESLVQDSSQTPENLVQDSSQSTENLVQDSSQTSEGFVAGDSDTKPVTFDLKHAISVGESIHSSMNGNLEWQGKIVHHKGGTLGAYEEVVNIFNGTNHHIYEIYNVLVNAHPELKTSHLEPYECEDINNYYGFTVSRAPAEINVIDNALREGKLVQLQVHSNKWRNAEGEQVDWPGYHSGLIFYFDGSLYHMKAAGKINQMNAVYTREQLIDWIGGTSKQLVIYTKHQSE